MVKEKRPTAPDELETLKKILEEEKAKADDFLNNLKRTQAEFINYKRRSQQEMSECSKMARCALILQFLPMFDDLERALEAVPPRFKNQPWVEGVRFIERKFKAILDSQGICAIEALGQPFNPNLHEAKIHQEGEEGIVVRELHRGYKLDDKVIRPSGVAVGSGEKALIKDEEDEDLSY
jgi:molecular chaperone GrpE